MITVYSWRWVPKMVRGYVRDVRVRWALEEAGIPYRNETIGLKKAGSDEYRSMQPFGQVPAYEEGDLRLSESASIIHHIALKSEKLMPKDPNEQARVLSWMFSALNSIEPFVMEWNECEFMSAKEEWAKLRKPSATQILNKRLDQLMPRLEGREYLEDRFTVADILMSNVLRMLNDSDEIKSRPILLDYRTRCEARPAFEKALADHMASFDESAGPPGGVLPAH